MQLISTSVTGVGSSSVEAVSYTPSMIRWSTDILPPAQTGSP